MEMTPLRLNHIKSFIYIHEEANAFCSLLQAMHSAGIWLGQEYLRVALDHLRSHRLL